MTDTDLETATLRLRYAISAERVLVAGRRVQRALKYNPNWHLQPRAPAGSPNSTGGQWIDDPVWAAREEQVLLVQAQENEHSNVDLIKEEAAGGHTIRMHVGRSGSWLLARARGEIYVLPFVGFGKYRPGSFFTLQAANRLVNATLARNREFVEAVANGLKSKAFLKSSFRATTGIEAFRESSKQQPRLRETYGVGVKIVHDPNAPNGFRVRTAYPRND